jgi:hypothetical protein
MSDAHTAEDARREASSGSDGRNRYPERTGLVKRPLYLHDLAQKFLGGGMENSDFLNARAQWEDKFYKVHFECFSCKVAAGVAEVTPKRPPYDYRSQFRRRRLFKKQRGDIQGWHFWREAIITSPQEHQYADLNRLLEDYADLYLRATYYTDPEDSAFCHRLLRTGLEGCIQAYNYWGASDEPLEDSCSKALRDRHSTVLEIYLRCAARRTVTQYTLGMLLGMLLIPVVVALNIFGFWVLDLLGSRVDPFAEIRISVYIGCTLGAVGAASSVLTRIASDKVNLDRESTRHGLFFWLNPVIQRGMVRVVVGSLFGGLVAWCLYGRILLPEAFQAAGESRTALTAVGAFIAGFSERFIPDLILRRIKPGA